MQKNSISAHRLQAWDMPMCTFLYIYTYLNYKNNIAAEKAPHRIAQETHSGQWTPMCAMGSPGGRGQRQSGHSLTVCV